jgi:leucyl-tRNA synthetase
MGPYVEGGDWSDKGIVGIDRFANRVWRIIKNFSDTRQEQCSNKDLLHIMHSTIKNVIEDTADFKFNTAISRILEYVNALYKAEEHIARDNLDTLALLLAPFAPHLGEELWAMLGHKPSIFQQKHPEYDDQYLEEATVEIVVQINGKVRDSFTIAANSSKEELQETALSREKVQNYVDGKQVVKTIVIPDRLVNIVIK